jgi:hypothetical protein
VAQFLAARTFVVDPFPDSQHFLIPVIAGAHRDTESVARLPNCLAIDEHQPMKVGLLRLRWVIDSSPEGPIDNEASLAIRIQALVPELLRPRLCVFPPQKMHGGLVTAAPTRFLAKMRSNNAFSKCSRHSSVSRAQMTNVPCASGAVAENFWAPL